MIRPTLRGRLDRVAHIVKAVTQQHHRDLLPLLRPVVASDAVILDVGAHAGQFTKLFARLAPRGRILAIEPSPYALGILRLVVALRRLRQVEIVPVGVSDAPGTATLLTPIKPSGAVGFGLASFARRVDRAAHRSDAVAVETLDAIADRFRLARIDLVKCDIEGFEVHALRGARRLLERFRPVLLLEISSASLARAGETPDAIWWLLAPLGYRGRRLGEPAWDDGFRGDGDYLFATPDRTELTDPPLRSVAGDRSQRRLTPAGRA